MDLDDKQTERLRQIRTVDRNQLVTEQGYALPYGKAKELGRPVFKIEQLSGMGFRTYQLEVPDADDAPTAAPAPAAPHAKPARRGAHGASPAPAAPPPAATHEPPEG